MTALALDPRRLAARIGIGAAFVLAFGWELDGALNNFVFIAGYADAAHRPLSAFAWVVLVLGFVIPVVGFVLGVALGARRTAGRFALVLTAAFCASEALTLSLLTLSVLTLFQTAVGAG